MGTLHAGIVGAGRIGRAHIAAIRSTGLADVEAVAMRDADRAGSVAKELGIPAYYGDYRDLVADPRVDVVHVCSPNVSHYEICKAAVLAGKPVLCEKPLAISAAQSGELLDLSIARNVKTAVNFVYRHYAPVKELRDIISGGGLGDIYAAHGEYLQDWLLCDSDYDWRVESSSGGPSRAMADIGSHWCDLACFLMGRKIDEACADLATFLPRRWKPGAAAAGRADGGERNRDGRSGGAGRGSGGPSLVDVDTEDYGSALLRFSGGVRGNCVISQVSAGGGTGPSIQIDGSRASALWDFGDPERLVIRTRNEPDKILIFREPARDRTHAQRDMIESFYASLANRDAAVGKRSFADFADGHHSVEAIEAMLRSFRSGRWEKVGV